MYRPRGVSLIELLVVVAIAALLTSISLPVLERARAGARGIMCESNLHQFGNIWDSYTVENDNKFMWRGSGDSRGAVSWFDSIRDYYDPNDEMLFCPLALRTPGEGGRNPRMAWDTTTDSGVYYKGSYGVNLWISNGGPTGHGSGGPNFNDWCWRTPLAGGVSYAPLLLCSQWKDMQPFTTDQPPLYDGQPWTTGPYNEMRRACIRRHDPYYVNILFLDFSVDRRTIKQLWRLKWHKEWPADSPLPIWFDWMSDIPEP